MRDYARHLVHPFIEPEGHYVYIFYKEEECIPFYVGKGIRRRAVDHLYGFNYEKESLVAKRIRNIIMEGYKLDIQIVEDNLSEMQAIQLEIRLITQFGRRDLDLGPLLNLTDGGEGQGGQLITPEIRKQRSDIQGGRPVIKKFFGIFIKRYEYVELAAED